MEPRAPDCLKVVKMGGRALPGGLGIPVLEGLHPALPEAVASLCTIRPSAQLQARVRGAWRRHDVQQLQEASALPVCVGRDPGQRRLMVQNRALICGKDRSGSSSLPSSWLCWGNGGPEQPRQQPKVTEARCCYKRKPQSPPPPRPELPGNAASVCSTGFSLLAQSSRLPWASGERRGLGATLLGGRGRVSECCGPSAGVPLGRTMERWPQSTHPSLWL